MLSLVLYVIQERLLIYFIMTAFNLLPSVRLMYVGWPTVNLDEKADLRPTISSFQGFAFRERGPA